MIALKPRTDKAPRYAAFTALLSLSSLTACDLLGSGTEAGAEKSPTDQAAQGAKGASSGAAPEPKDAPQDPAPASPKADTPAPLPGVDGASVAWSAKATAAPKRILVSDSGGVVALLPESIVGFSGGAQAWTEDGFHTQLVRLNGGEVLTATVEKIIAVDPSSGALVFETPIPLAGDAVPKKRGQPVAPPAVVAAASVGSQVLLALADARFFVVDPPACKAKEAACLRDAGALEGEFLEPDAGLAVAADGTRFLQEDDTLRGFNATMDLDFELAAHARIVGITTGPQNRIALSFGGEVALLDGDKCRGRGEVRLGRGFASSGPRGCVVWRYGGELDNTLPALVDGTAIAANGNLRLQLAVQGTDSWKSPLGSLGPVSVGENGELYTATVEERGDDPPSVSLAAVRADKGTLLWSVPLPFEVEAGMVVVADSLRMDWRPGWVALAFEEQVAVVAIPATPPSD